MRPTENDMMQNLKPFKTWLCWQMTDGKTCHSYEYIECVPTMCDGATSTRNGQWLSMKPITRIMLLNL